tara:strand:- start:282 stop:800 length:519 start_codon:yes stop_codon:yes gene_type:complete
MTDLELSDLCNEKLKYNPESGHLKWITRPRGRSKTASLDAGHLNKLGYIEVRVKQTLYLAHRLAYLIHYGNLPKYIDHINGIKNDNRIINLRSCTNQENLRNQKIKKSNTSGYKGVSWHKAMKKWSVRITTDKHYKFIGNFTCRHEAARAYNDAAIKHHGEFAYLNTIGDLK